MCEWHIYWSIASTLVALRPPCNFHYRTHSNHCVSGTKSVWLKNAKIWTGGHNGTEFIYGDTVLDWIYWHSTYRYILSQLLGDPDLEVEDVKGAWIGPSLVDLHSDVGAEADTWLRGGTWQSTL
jgi:hypothetical protein